MSSLDALVSPTLKHLREEWWDDEFTKFLVETLRPRPGNRILDVGCGAGEAQVSIGHRHVSQVRLFGADLRFTEVAAAAKNVASHNVRARFAAGDARRLPFADRAFDSTYCVAVLQHITEVEAAVAEFARVTRPSGRIVAVEPDNTARYAYSSVPSGAAAFARAAAFYGALANSSGNTEGAVGPRLPGMFAAHGIEPVMVRLFPVAQSRLGTPGPDVWDGRRAALERALLTADETARALGAEYRDALDAYERDAKASSGVFAEIQHTMLFATVGQREG